MSKDEQIKKDVTDQLYWDSRVDASDVDISVQDGVVTLSGTVPSFRSLDAAYDDAVTVVGVLRVVNDLTIDYTTVVNLPTDDELEISVNETLRTNPDVESSEIDVTVNTGVVTLKGTVPTYWQKLDAETTASRLLGTTEVVNNLGVVPSDKLSDKMIAEDIIAALDRNIMVDTNDIDVEVEEGVVTLSGTVASGYIRDLVFDAAVYTSGVVDVIDSLVIEV